MRSNLVMIVAGTRPEAIKLAPVFWWLEKIGVDYVFVWSGQHYDYEMSRVFFEQLRLPKPAVDLDVRSGTHAEQTAKIMMGLEEAVDKYKPTVVVAQGDTNTVVAAALTAAKKLVPFAHVEAGLRSWDRTMPEEINRIVADAVAHLCFAPTALAATNLMHEGVPISRIRITGNTIVDVVHSYRDIASEEGEKMLKELDLQPHSYVLVTIHRQENTDNPERLQSLVKALAKISRRAPVVFPAHPRTVNRLRGLGLLESLKDVRMLKPLGYFQFLGLLRYAAIVLTDSGGVQEEACLLKIPTLTLRYNTERPETVMAGLNRLVGTEEERIVMASFDALERREEIIKHARDCEEFLGHGDAGQKIAKTLADANVEVPTADTRADPYITYAILDAPPPNCGNCETVAMYDETGLAVEDATKAKKYLIRGPLTELLKWLR